MPPSNRPEAIENTMAQPADPRLLSNRHHSTLRSGLGVRESQRNLILAVHLIFGLIVLAAGFGVMSGAPGPLAGHHFREHSGPHQFPVYPGSAVLDDHPYPDRLVDHLRSFVHRREPVYLIDAAERAAFAKFISEPEWISSGTSGAV